jgi:hypothetical protein
MRKLIWALLALVAAPLHAAEAERWELTDARVAIRFNAGLVRDLGIRITPEGRPDRDDYTAYEIGAEGRLVALSPGSLFLTVESGALRFTIAPDLAWKAGAASLLGARLQPGKPGSYTITGADGSPLFFADHQHFEVDRQARQLHLFNLDLRLSPELAARLGEPRHAGLSVGVLEIAARAAIPAGAVEQPLGACTTPNYGNPHNDVGLIGVTQVSQQARGETPIVVAVAPSSVLKNVGQTDVPWVSKFAPNHPPYNNDQHPFLVWNMYRVSNGALQQIAASGLKHAFLTLNTNCGCPQGDILWVGNGGCEDVYSTGTNNSTSSLGPRSEVTAHTGVWQRCGSIFDANCDNIQDGVPGFTGAGDPRRLAVLETDLQTPGALYYFDSWYIVRDDVNIFNTMGYRQINPVLSGSTWSFGLLTGLTAGGVVDAWVNPSSPGPNAETRKLDTGEGKLTLAMRATDLGAGQWRYDYALMNHDFDRKIRSFSVPLPADGVVTNASFHDVDRNAATDWALTVTPGVQIVWNAPNAASAQDWGLLYSFSFQVNAAPTPAGGSLARLGTQEAPGDDITTPIMAPAGAAAFVRGDFNADGRTDILWRHDDSGENVLWFMNGANLVSGTFLTPAALGDTRWKMVGTHDFNADLKTDILWRHDTSGENVVWYMNGSVLTSGTFTTPSALADVSWRVAGTGDFNGDGKPDIVFHHQGSGQVVIWYMNGSVLASGTFTTPSALPDTTWQLVGVADFSSPADGKPDLVWRNQVTGENLVWFMNNAVKLGESLTTPTSMADTGWQIVATGDYSVPADFKTDIVWRHSVSGQNLIWLMSGTVLTSASATNPAAVSEVRWSLVGPRLRCQVGISVWPPGATRPAREDRVRARTRRRRRCRLSPAPAPRPTPRPGSPPGRPHGGPPRGRRPRTAIRGPGSRRFRLRPAAAGTPRGPRRS